MGVRFRPCDSCCECFPDCGDCDHCENDHRLCSDCMPRHKDGKRLPDQDEFRSLDDGVLAKFCVVCQRGGTTEERLEKQVALLTDQMQLARTYTGLEGYGCPLCTYENGVFIKSCTPCERYETLSAHCSVVEDTCTLIRGDSDAVITDLRTRLDRATDLIRRVMFPQRPLTEAEIAYGQELAKTLDVERAGSSEQQVTEGQGPQHPESPGTEGAPSSTARPTPKFTAPSKEWLDYWVKAEEGCLIAAGVPDSPDNDKPLNDAERLAWNAVCMAIQYGQTKGRSVAFIATEVMDRLRLLGVWVDDPEGDDTPYAHPAWWRGEENGVAGAAMRWDQALTRPYPHPGVMNEPLESVYRRTEALRSERDAMRAALRSLRREHYVCDDDCWYSCPASGQCCDSARGTACDCSAEKDNAMINLLLGENGP